MIDKMIDEILSNAHCTISSFVQCCSDEYDCKECAHHGVDYEDIVQIANKYKEQEQKWISVEDKLPEEEGKYLCAVEYSQGRFHIDIYGFTKNAYELDEHGFDLHKGNMKAMFFYDYDPEFGYFERNNVVAWMPLPKYEGTVEY